MADDITKRLGRLRQAQMSAQLKAQENPSKENQNAAQAASDALQKALDELRPIVDSIEDPNEKALARLVWFMGYSVDQVAVGLCRSRSGLYRHMMAATKYVEQRRKNDVSISQQN